MGIIKTVLIKEFIKKKTFFYVRFLFYRVVSFLICFSHLQFFFLKF